MIVEIMPFSFVFVSLINKDSVDKYLKAKIYFVALIGYFD